MVLGSLFQSLIHHEDHKVRVVRLKPVARSFAVDYVYSVDGKDRKANSRF